MNEEQNWEPLNKPKAKSIITVFFGGGTYGKFVDCEISDRLAPDLTFIGRHSEWPEHGRHLYVTTAPYLIDHGVVEE